MATEGKLYLYPTWLRIWHAVNALGIILLIISGLNLQFAAARFSILSFNLAVNLHNIAGVIVSIGYIVFFFGNIFSGNRKFYRIKVKGREKRLIKQAKYYLFGMFKGENPPYPISEKRKFNPLQKYSYVAVMYFFVPLVIVSGIALLFPEIIIEEVYTVSGITLTALTHAILGFTISIFLFVHIYVASIGKSPINNFKSIITGWHE
jgi:thiosulfate reductase cytochrome b subunit